MTLAGGGFERYGKTTRRAAFLADMERVVPWAQLCALIEPVYPKAGNGRPPVGLERMLRIYFLRLSSFLAATQISWLLLWFRIASRQLLPSGAQDFHKFVIITS